MAKSKTIVYIISLILLSIFAIIVLYSLSYIPLFNISAIKMYGVSEVSAPLEKLISSYYNVNRFKIDFSKEEERIKSFCQVEDAIIRWKFPSTIEIHITETQEKCLLFDENGYYMNKGGRLVELDSDEASFLKDKMVIIEVLPEYVSYLKTYGIRGQLDNVLSLIAAVGEENGALISRIKYDNNNSDSFGQIVITLASLSSQLFVKERVSKDRISDSIKVIRKEAESEVSTYTKKSMIRYDLYKDALVKRLSSGDINYGK